MNEYYQLIDEIIALLNTATPDKETTTDVAERYKAACQKANQRLQECEDLLRKGHRSEAIQRANIEPDLLDVVGVLAFPELDIWIAFLGQVGFPAPPLLKSDFARELNRQIAEELPLEKLLRKHRLLALGRAPLATRIAQLRIIRDKDPNSSAWHTDILALEKARIRQITAKVKEVAQTKNSLIARQLVTELENGEWSIPVPDELCSVARKIAFELGTEEMHRHLEQIARDLSQAWNELDFEAGRQHRERWNHLFGRTTLPAGSPILEMAEDALNWLEEEDIRLADDRSFQRALQAQERAIDDPLSGRDELEATFRNAESFSQPVPEILVKRLRDRLERIELAGKRKQRIRYAMVILILMVAGAAVTGIIFVQKRNAAVAEAVAKASGHFHAREYNELLEWHERLLEDSPGVAINERVQEWVKKANTALQLFAANLQKYNHQYGLAKGDGEPGQIDEEALEKAEELAALLSTDQQIEIADLRSEFDIYQEVRRRERLDEFNEKLIVIAEKIRLLSGGEDVTTAKINDAQLELNTLVQEFFDLPSATKRQADVYMTRLVELEKYWKAKEFIQEWYETGGETVGDAGSYELHLRTFTRKFPDDLISEDIESVLDEKDLWIGMLAWSDYYRKPVFEQFDQLKNSQVEVIKQEGMRLAGQFGDSPLADRFADHLEHMEAVKKRTSIDAPKFLGFLDKSINTEYRYIVKLKDGPVYYLKNKIANIQQETLLFHALDGINGSDEIFTESKESIEYYGESPVQNLSMKIGKLLIDALTDNSLWDAHCLEMYELALSEGPMLQNELKNEQVEVAPDAIWRAITLNYIVQLGFDGGGAFQAALENVDVDEETIESMGMDLFVDWVEPVNTDAAIERGLADRLINGPWQRKLNTFKEGFASIRSRYLSASDCRFEWFGFAGKTGVELTPRWNVVVGSSSEKDETGVLSVVFKKLNNEVVIKTVGKVDGGKIELDEPLEKGSLIVGRPVFLLRAVRSENSEEAE